MKIKNDVYEKDSHPKIPHCNQLFSYLGHGQLNITVTYLVKLKTYSIITKCC